MTGGRIKRIKDYVGGGSFMLTYGDGVSDIDISALYNNHTIDFQTDYISHLAATHLMCICYNRSKQNYNS